MNRRGFLKTSSFAAGILWSGLGALSAEDFAHLAIRRRSCVVCIDSRLEAGTRARIDRLLTINQRQPLLTAFLEGSPLMSQSTSDALAGDPLQLALNHLIVVGLADDALVQTVWQREASIKGSSIYAFGFGNLQGSIGYIESDRNPLLHVPSIPTIPYESELVTITGTDEMGLELGVRAFLEKNLTNGIIAATGWKRGTATLLDRDPLPAAFVLPEGLPTTLSDLRLVGVTQASEDEYRGVLADTGVSPESIWRGKYYADGVWDGAGIKASFFDYAAGLHRRAYGNTVWYATFESSQAASSAAGKIAAAAKLTARGAGWSGNLPPFAWADPISGDVAIPGSLELACTGSTVVMTSRLVIPNIP